MRLLVIVPAYNEAQSVGEIVSRVPKLLPGFSSVEVVVVDDGSTDGTGDVAKKAGVVVLRHPERRGLAAAFRTGHAYGIDNGAALFVTLDADGQYRPEEITKLIEIFSVTNADLVVGDRQIHRLKHMPLSNRVGNILGSWMLRVIGATPARDASSGFRLFNRRLAEKLWITSDHTYTHEMLIQAKRGGFTVAQTPVTFLPRVHGKSKLVRTLRDHILRSCGTIVRSFFRPPTY